MTGLIVFLVGAGNEYGHGGYEGVVIDTCLVYVLHVAFSVIPQGMARGAGAIRPVCGTICKAVAGIWVLAAPVFFFLPTNVDGLYQRALGLVTFVFVLTMAFVLLGRAAAPEACGTSRARGIAPSAPLSHPGAMTAYLSGFGLGFSLILAIGAQNAFVLRQGLRGEHVLAVVLTCALSDAVLIMVGVAGFGALALAAPWIVPAFRWGGALFLAAYGARAFLSAWRGGAALQAGTAAGSRVRAVATCLALTWLNPHVYLDTMILLGSVSIQSPDPRLFGAGAITASFAFFFSLGFGAALLRPIFARPSAWRVLDVGIGLVMWALALGLMLG